MPFIRKIKNKFILWYFSKTQIPKRIIKKNIFFPRTKNDVVEIIMIIKIS